MTDIVAPQIVPVDIIPAPRTPDVSESLATPAPAPETHHHLLDVDLQVFASPAEAAEQVLRRARGHHRGLGVFTCNVDHLMMVGKHDEFRRAYGAADVVTIDGAPLALLSRYTGTGSASRVTGVDLTQELIRCAARDGLKVALVGGAAGRGDAAATRVRDQFPDLPAMFVDSPQMGFQLGDDEDDRLVRALQVYGPDVIIVCLGAPKQELWIDRHRGDLPGAVLVGAGATIDFLSGHQPRAPRVFQRTGTEAFYRLATDFRRLWRRYLVQDTKFLAIFAIVLLSCTLARLGLEVVQRSHAMTLGTGSITERSGSCRVCSPNSGQGGPPERSPL